MGDKTETLVFGPDVAIVQAADYAAAEALAGSRSTRTDCRIQRNLSITLEITTFVGAGSVFIATRSSGKAAPNIATATDWARMNRTANIDVTTGVDTSKPLIEEIEVTALGRHTLDLPVTSRFVSLIIWSDISTLKGSAFTYRSA